MQQTQASVIPAHPADRECREPETGELPETQGQTPVYRTAKRLCFSGKTGQIPEVCPDLYTCAPALMYMNTHVHTSHTCIS